MEVIGSTVLWFQRSIWLRNILMVMMMLGVSLYMGKYTSFRPDTVLQLVMILVAILPAFLLAVTGSPVLIFYVSLIWVIAPEIRRLADYSLGSYEPISLISLLPLFVTAMILIRLLQLGIPDDKPAKSLMISFLVPFLYAAAIGLLINKAAGLYSMLTAVAPLLIMIYLVCYPLNTASKDRFMRSYATLAVLVSLYGWFQYIYLPPWDLMWMQGAKMISLGKPEPMQFRVFSTLNSTGPLAVFLVSALIPMVVNKRWRGPFGLLGILIVLSSLSTTLVRSAWVTLVVGIIGYMLYSRNASRLRTFVTLGIITCIAMVALPLLPNSEKLTDRVGTFSNLNEDSSFNARIKLALYAAPEILKHPLGMGFGSIGQSNGKLNKGEGFAGLGSVDNGYLGIFATFGLVGGILFFRAIWKYYRRISRTNPVDNPYRPLALAMILQLLVSFLFGGTLEGYGAILFFLFTGFAFGREKEKASL